MGSTASSELELLVFDLGGRTYGLASSEVVELVRAVAIAPLPAAPRIVAGVINVRGRIVPVFDLRVRFGLPSPPVELTDHFIVTRARHRVVAIRTDRAMKLVTVARDDVMEAERIVSGTRYISGIARIADGVILIHDVDAFLSEAESATLDQALGAPCEAS
ncbi:MAG TPA: chemotaxis protein CheW [Polyangiaceae bacterium]|nr:chemotaxis protein CheW [Polyangiaceae bacterium]